ncbi:MAG TPA: sigma-70 family RNA polymerase sigma factor [Chthoniobacteraceae bacterium]|jgi:RNA polymerase sigma factor (sigma-70 family)|nr:sigma-70 family RNA polymerase sigma factor [Chthoniobacteraceae bacterium]
MNTQIDNAGSCPDAELAERCIGGDQHAFRMVVERHQSLVCSVAYAACGDLHLSEEVAQDTFLTAWGKLQGLREPVRLKAWLCGIARNLGRNALRRSARKVESCPLEADVQSQEGTPRELAISKEEEAMLWSALGELPENYREPMILYYREAESVGAVAEALEISEDAVKQRLARGRVMLAGQIERSIRAALRSSGPGRAFTIGVLAAIPAVTVSARAASLGAAVAKGGTTAKTAVMAGIFSALLGPVLVLGGNFLTYRISIQSAVTKRERWHVRRTFLGILGIVAGFVTAFDLLILWAHRYGSGHHLSLAGCFVGLALAFSGSAAWLIVSSMRERRMLIAERLAAGIPLDAGGPSWEYRSRAHLLGLPLVHLRFGNSFAWRNEPVWAWIAAGDRAFGMLFAFGGIAIAPVSLGGFAIGLLPWGAFGIGLCAIGAFAFGWWAVGGMAFGCKAYAGCAVAWRGAMGGVAISRGFAEGGLAYAPQANNGLANRWLFSHAFFRGVDYAGGHLQWLNLLWVLPLFQWWLVVRKHRKGAQAA